MENVNVNRCVKNLVANYVAIYHVIFRQIIWFETFFFEKSILTLKFKHRDLINEIEISLWKISIN